MRFKLRTFLVFVCMLSVCIGLLANRKNRRKQLIARLTADQVYFEMSSEDTFWIDQLPLIGAGDSIVSVSYGSYSNLSPETVNCLNEIGTVTELEYCGIEYQGLRLLSQIKTLKKISYLEGHHIELSAKHVELFAKHPLTSFQTNGALIMPDALKILYAIPTIEIIGTRWGDTDVPDELKKSRPDLSVYETDISA